ncbi:AraC family transcriptional regulator [Photobacterium leiognathi subsp. mandapamensis]|uniref:AraC family transcriptional regulator n=1 Tax=Photobacterium leiognathi TaxID=553611 RepID=UPI003BF5600F
MDSIDTFTISPKCQSIIIDQIQSIELERHKILQCGINYGKEAFSIYRRNPEMYMLLYTTKGKGLIKTPEKEWPLEAGSVIYIPPAQENCFIINPEDNETLEWDVAWVMLESNSHWDKSLPHDVHYNDSQSCDLLFKTITCLNDALSFRYPLGDALCRSITEQICLLVENRSTSHAPKALTRLEHVFQQTKSQLHHPWQVSDLAKLYPCSEPHFHRLCQQYFQQSPIAHLTQIRMEHAAGLLTTTNWSIQHISDLCGYPNPTNFSTRFKAWSRFTPRQFRSQFQPKK